MAHIVIKKEGLLESAKDIGTALGQMAAFEKERPAKAMEIWDQHLIQMGRMLSEEEARKVAPRYFDKKTYEIFRKIHTDGTASSGATSILDTVTRGAVSPTPGGDVSQMGSGVQSASPLSGTSTPLPQAGSVDAAMVQPEVPVTTGAIPRDQTGAVLSDTARKNRQTIEERIDISRGQEFLSSLEQRDPLAVIQTIARDPHNEQIVFHREKVTKAFEEALREIAVMPPIPGASPGITNEVTRLRIEGYQYGLRKPELETKKMVTEIQQAQAGIVDGLKRVDQVGFSLLMGEALKVVDAYSTKDQNKINAANAFFNAARFQYEALVGSEAYQLELKKMANALTIVRTQVQSHLDYLIAQEKVAGAEGLSRARAAAYSDFLNKTVPDVLTPLLTIINSKDASPELKKETARQYDVQVSAFARLFPNDPYTQELTNFFTSLPERAAVEDGPGFQQLIKDLIVGLTKNSKEEQDQRAAAELRLMGPFSSPRPGPQR